MSGCICSYASCLLDFLLNEIPTHDFLLFLWKTVLHSYLCFLSNIHYKELPVSHLSFNFMVVWDIKFWICYSQIMIYAKLKEAYLTLTVNSPIPALSWLCIFMLRF